MLGDTVRFTSVNPYKFVITGRTKSFINAFGEELIVDNAEQGLAYACQQTGAQMAGDMVELGGLHTSINTIRVMSCHADVG